MSLKFCKFKFIKKTSPKLFCKYEIISSNPYSDKKNFNGNSVRYQILQYKENKKDNKRMFIYVLNNQYLLTYGEITKIPPDLKDIELRLVSKDETFPITEETLDLYCQWVKYYVYRKIVSYCAKNKYAYDYRVENHYAVSLSDIPNNKLNVVIKRIFNVDAEVLSDGTAYLSVNIHHEFESKNNLYDLIKQNRNVIDMKVKCLWQIYDNHYIVQKVNDITIENDIDTENSTKKLNLIDYWNKKLSKEIENIDKNAPIVSAYNKKKKRTEHYIPQSLFPIVTREYILMNDRNFSKKVDRYIKLSMQERIEIIQRFLKVLNLKKMKGKDELIESEVIELLPTPIKELGYQSYDMSQKLPTLFIANNQRIKFNEKYKVFKQGFYKVPEKTIVAAFMSYDTEAKQSYEVVKAVLDFTRGKVNGVRDNRVNEKLLPLKFYQSSFHYEKGDMLSYTETAHKIKEAGNVNFVVAPLPIEIDEEEFYKDSIASPYDSFKHVFADLEIPSQMLSLNMIKDIDTNNIFYRLQNIVLGILCKAGGVPWILEKPLDDVDCFIGLDVGTQEKGIHYPACSVCLDGQGNFIGYYSTNVAQKGEKIDTKSLEVIFNNVLIAYKQSSGEYPKHIVIHRDGFSNEEKSWYIEYFNRRNIEFDVVEIRKNISVRLLEENEASNGMNPKSGSTVIKDNTAYIITTNVKKYLGSPRPLLLVHRHGNLPIEKIARQVYILSEMHIGSMRTSRLPLTTLYADKICKNHDHVPHNILTNQLYFL